MNTETHWPTPLERKVRFAFGAFFALLPATYLWMQLAPIPLVATFLLYAGFCIPIGYATAKHGDTVWLHMLHWLR